MSNRGGPPIGDVSKKQVAEQWEKTSEKPGFHMNDWKRQMKVITPAVTVFIQLLHIFLRNTNDRCLTSQYQLGFVKNPCHN